MQFGSRYLHKHLHPIYIKHAHISQLLDFIAIQRFHTSRAFVEVIAKRDSLSISVMRMKLPLGSSGEIK